MKSLLLDVFLHYNSSFSCRCNYFHNIFLKRRPLSRNSCQSRNYAAVSLHSPLQSTQRHSQMYAERHLYLSPVKCHLLATWISLQAIIWVSNSSSGRTYAKWLFWVVSYFTNLPPLFLPPLCLHRPKNPVLGKETFTEELLWKMCFIWMYRWETVEKLLLLKNKRLCGLLWLFCFLLNTQASWYLCACVSRGYQGITEPRGCSNNFSGRVCSSNKFSRRVCLKHG